MAKKGGNHKGFTKESLLQKGFRQLPDGSFIPPDIKRDNLSRSSPEYYKDFVFKNSFGTINTSEHKRSIVVNDDFIIRTGDLLMTFDIDPIGKPRMTQQDKWRTDPNHPNPKSRQRKNVGLYWKYKAQLVEQAIKNDFKMPQSDFHIIFHIPMPHSWSMRKKAVMRGNPHQQKPDVDNLGKGIFDCLLSDDSGIWDCRITKLWADSGKILIYKL